MRKWRFRMGFLWAAGVCVCAREGQEENSAFTFIVEPSSGRRPLEPPTLHRPISGVGEHWKVWIGQFALMGNYSLSTFAATDAPIIR